MQEAQKLTQEEEVHDDLLQSQRPKRTGKVIDYQSPIKAKHMRKVFGPSLGAIWSDICKRDTALNLMLSSPIFRHASDPEAAKLDESIRHGSITPSNEVTPGSNA